MLKRKIVNYAVILLAAAISAISAGAADESGEKGGKGNSPETNTDKYQAVRAAIQSRIKLLIQDLGKLKTTYPQLAGIESVKIQDSRISWSTMWFKYDQGLISIDSQRREGGTPVDIVHTYKFRNGGCYILVDFRYYDQESDPTLPHGTGAASASPPSHYLVVESGVPFGLKVELEAEKTEEGRAFARAVSEVIEKHKKALLEDLGAKPVGWTQLLEDQD